MKYFLMIMLVMNLPGCQRTMAQIFKTKISPGDSLLRVQACRLLKLPYEYDAPMITQMTGYLKSRQNTVKALAPRALKAKAPLRANAQRTATDLDKVWDKTFGGYNDACHAIVNTGDGGYLLGGTTQGGNIGDVTEDARSLHDFWIVKTNAQGDKQWDKRFGGGESGPARRANVLRSLVQTNDGGYMLGGSSSAEIGWDKSESSRGDHDYWIVKINAQGVKEWDKRFGGTDYDELSTLIQTTDNGYLLVGSSVAGQGGDRTAPALGSGDYWVVKIDSRGIKEWDKAFGTAGWDVCNAVVQTSDGGYLLGGFASGDNDYTAANYWVIKIDAHGERQWDKKFRGDSFDHLTTMVQTDDGGFLLGGASSSQAGLDKSQPSQGTDFWVIKIDAGGNKVWDKVFGGSGTDYCASILKKDNGDFVLFGYTDSPAGSDLTEDSKGGFDYWCLRISATGNKQWDKRFGGGPLFYYDDWLTTATTGAQDDTYVLGGYSNSDQGTDKTEPPRYRGQYDYWIVKVQELSAPVNLCGTAITFPNNKTLCKGDQVDLSVNNPDVTASWEIPDDVEKETIGVIKDPFIFAPDTTTTLKVTLSKAGCSPVSKLITIVVHERPEVELVSMPDVCPGESFVMEASEVPGATYHWQPMNATTRAVTVAPSDWTSYSLEVTLNGCSNTKTFLPQFKSKASAGMDETICVAGQATLRAGEADSYAWSTGETTQEITFDPTTAGSYTFSVTATTDGCSTTDEVVVTVNAYCPGTPIGFLAQPVAINRIDLHWDEPAGNQTEYVIQRQDASGTFADLATVPAGTHDYQDADLTEGTAYAYRIFSRAGTEQTKEVYAAARTFLPDMNFVRETSVTAKDILPKPTHYAPNADAVNDLISSLTKEQRHITWTYYNGLGTEIQTVVQQESPSGKDVVTPVYFDEFGMSSRQYLAFTKEQDEPGNYVDRAEKHAAVFYASPPDKVAGTPDAYSQTVFEKSPLNRIVKQGGIGPEWQPTPDAQLNDHAVKSRLELNAEHEVLRFGYNPFSNTFFFEPYFWPVGWLYKTKTYDDDNTVVIEFKDLNGRLILKRVQLARGVDPPLTRTNYADTYYIYDPLGRLVEILTPEAVKHLKELHNID
ncbi:DUF6443 domain-containing protein [Chryseolinea serpens]|nr:DUF6443 domain-containing protein [Chryseolinea serpens]